MKTVKIQGFKEHLFVEGSGYNVTFLNSNVVPVKKSKNYFKSKDSSKEIQLRLDFINNSKKSLNDQKYNDLYTSNKRNFISPFIEKNNAFIEKSKNKSIFCKNYGANSGNLLFNQQDTQEFKDIQKFSVKTFVGLTEIELMQYDFPFEFNTNEYYKKSSRIDIFDFMNKLKFSSIGVDKLKGARGFALKSGLDANKRNINIENKYRKYENSHTFFEDGVLSTYVYNKNKRTVIDSITETYDPITGETSSQISYRSVTVISKEPRYSNLEEVKIKPFFDSAHSENNSLIKNDSQIFINKLTNVEINNVLLTNRNKYNYLEEDYVYLARGKTVDYSSSNGLDSLVFHESLD